MMCRDRFEREFAYIRRRMCARNSLECKMGGDRVGVGSHARIAVCSVTPGVRDPQVRMGKQQGRNFACMIAVRI